MNSINIKKVIKEIEKQKNEKSLPSLYDNNFSYNCGLETAIRIIKTNIKIDYK